MNEKTDTHGDEVETSQFLSTYSEIHALVLGVFSGVLLYVLRHTGSSHIKDAWSEAAYTAGGSLLGYALLKWWNR